MMKLTTFCNYTEIEEDMISAHHIQTTRCKYKAAVERLLLITLAHTHCVSVRDTTIAKCKGSWIS
jgi:hypothetical protein